MDRFLVDINRHFRIEKCALKGIEMKFVELFDESYANPLRITNVVPVFDGVRIYFNGPQGEFIEMRAPNIAEAKKIAKALVMKIEAALRDE